MKSIANVLVLLTLTIFLTSCGTAVKQLEIFKVEEPRAPLNLESPQAPKMESLNWVIITSENADEVFAKLKENGKDPVLFGLSDDDYELLAKNFAQIRAYIIQQNATLDQYKKYYEPSETKE